ncbi:MAG TPA: toll/interleukin-1 receptor domain-containing protein [Ktedonobacteraceae bacterium]|jgi:hypothetical protein
MSYRADLEAHIRASYKLIQEYENIVLLTSSPREKASARAAIEDQWEMIKETLDTYLVLCRRLTLDLAPDIAELVAHFPQSDLAGLPAPVPVRPPGKAIKVFISYALEDEQWCSLLLKHMQLLRREGYIEQWYRRQISPGMEWNDVICQQLDSSQLILLLISPDYMNSDYCYNIEMARALQRQAAHEAIVLPIILRPVDWRGAPAGQLKALPTDNRALTVWPDLDQALLSVVNEIRLAVVSLLEST